MAELTLQVEDEILALSIDAPFANDPPPAGPAGPTPRLWDYEVVELFLLGAEDHYLELEFGPHGHYLALFLEGRRNCTRSDLKIDYNAEIRGVRWYGDARIPLEHLPAGLERANAYAIRGVGPQRRYMAAASVPGAQPDFHRLQYFTPIDLTPCHHRYR